jgi:ribosomal protein L11 methylase PrmA
MESLADLSPYKKFAYIVANIQSDILQKYSSELLNVMDTNGTLILSGILSTEKETVKSHFENKIKNMKMNFQVSDKTINEWSLLEFILKVG